MAAAPRYERQDPYLDSTQEPEIWQNIMDILQGGRLQGEMSPEEREAFGIREAERKEEYLSDLVRSGITGGEQADFLDEFVRGLERDRTLAQQERISEAIGQALQLGGSQEQRGQFGYGAEGTERYRQYQSEYRPWELRKQFQYQQRLQEGQQQQPSWQEALLPALGMGAGFLIGGPPGAMLGGALGGGVGNLYGGSGGGGSSFNFSSGDGRYEDPYAKQGYFRKPYQQGYDYKKYGL